MTIPTLPALMRPILARLSDGSVMRARDLTDAMADHFGLDEQERAALLPSGRARSFANRVAWALTHLAQAGLLERPARGQVALTDAGREVLAAHPERVDMAVLRQFPSYREFRARSSKPAAADDATSGQPEAPDAVPSEAAEASPQDLVAQAVRENEAAVRGELLGRALKLTPADFERLVIALLVAMGYGAAGVAEHSGRPGDAGIDGIISRDPLGLDRIYVQAKRYARDQHVQRPAVQGFVGALMGAQGDRGVFITTSTFTTGARQEADRVSARVELIDGERLAALMLRHGVGVQAETSVVLHQVDEDFFESL